jgi:hypothetical protein
VDPRFVPLDEGARGSRRVASGAGSTRLINSIRFGAARKLKVTAPTWHILSQPKPI